MPHPATAIASPRSFRYQVETDDGRRYELEVDRQIPDTAEGRQLLERLLHEQLRQEPTERFKNRPSLKSVTGQVLGGMIDVGQGMVDQPFEIANTIREFFAATPPGGPPGSRQPFLPALQSPTLPNVREPRNTPEQVARTGSEVLTSIGAALLAPPVRRGVTRGLERLIGSGERELPLLFEPGAAVSRPLNRLTPAVPTLGPATTPDRLSEGAAVMARRIFDLPSSVSQLRAMTLEQLTQAHRRILHLVPDVDLADMSDPVAELLRLVEGEILRHR